MIVCVYHVFVLLDFNMILLFLSDPRVAENRWSMFLLNVRREQMVMLMAFSFMLGNFPPLSG